MEKEKHFAIIEVKLREQEKYKRINDAIREYIDYAEAIPALSGNKELMSTISGNTLFEIREYLKSLRNETHKEICKRLNIEKLL